MRHLLCPFIPASPLPLLLTLVLAASGCGGGSDSSDVSPEDVDESTPVEITEEERAAFEAPGDSVLSEDHVEQYLKASLLQFDLVRKHAATIHERVKKMEERGEEGGALGGLRNMVDASQTMAEYGDLIGGSYIRASRTLGYNPAEMEWVRERLGELSGYLAMVPVQQEAAAGAAEMRKQAETLQQQLASGQGAEGYSEADIQQMLQMADQMGADPLGNAPPSVRSNVEVLHRARPAVTDQMWTAIGMAGGAMGLIALTGLSDPNDAEAQKKLDEYRQLYTDALENRVSAGMEAEPATGAPADTAAGTPADTAGATE